MKIKVLRKINLDIYKENGISEMISPSDKIIEIDDKKANERNYLERFEKFPSFIKIIEKPLKIKTPEVPEVPETTKKKAKSKKK